MLGLKKLSPKDKNRTLQRLCKTDLFFLLSYVLRRTDIQGNERISSWVFDRCREVEADPNGYLDLWAREHYKSTIITFAKTIQDILIDPEITVGFFSHTRPNAKKFLVQIMRELEDNERLKEIFPEILWSNPRREAPKWSEDEGIVVKRSGNPKEPTISAWGLVDGMPTGAHFKLRVYDDTVTLESVNTPDQISKTTEAWEMSDNLGMIGGTERYIGTRYALWDTYSEMIKRKAVKVRIYPATHNRRLDGKPVLFTEEFWEKKKRTQSRRTLAAQHMQNPLADEEASFRIEWLRPFEVRPRTLNVSITCDPSKGRNASSDNTAIAVIGIGSNNNRYLLDGYCHRMTLSQRWQALRDLYIKWSNTPGVQLVDVGYERYGAQSDDEYFQMQMEEASRLGRSEEIFTIKELNWTLEGTKGEQGKRTRVERLEPDFRNSHFYLPLAVMHDGRPCTWKVDMDPDSKTFQTVLYAPLEGFTKQQLRAMDGGSPDLICQAIKRVNEERQVYDLTEKFIEEFLSFPFGHHKDLLDAASRLYDMDMRAPQIYAQSATDPRTYVDS